MGVIGVPDRFVGHNVKAVIVLKETPEEESNETEIVKFCQDKLAYYKIPKIIEFVGEIPKTDIGKVSRRRYEDVE